MHNSRRRGDNAEACAKPCQTSKMERFAKIVNDNNV